tara:strand:+ start:3021 stop:3542 length:522 start_codon:yes stop_codon:yes gene_type:complete
MHNENIIIWFTGLPCSGKTSLSEILYNEIKKVGKKVILFDGDILRDGINSDLNFSKNDRTENLRRTMELSKIFISEGYNVIVSQITPTNDQRSMIKQNLESKLKFIYLDCSLEKCIKRDVKGMYKKAMSGEISNFTGINDKYEIPTNADFIINTDDHDINESAKEIIKFFKSL